MSTEAKTQETPLEQHLRLPYTTARAEVFYLDKITNILEHASLEGEIEDFEDGENI